jgi:hypothetical protein
LDSVRSRFLRDDGYLALIALADWRRNRKLAKMLGLLLWRIPNNEEAEETQLQIEGRWMTASGAIRRGAIL